MPRTFHQDLILNQWVLSLFNQQDLAQFKQRLGDKEGINQDGQTQYFHALQWQLFDSDKISVADLRRYDLNIVQHWQQITEQRNKIEGHILNLKYFQYLSLLFSEIYLDYYFNHTDKLLNELNDQLSLHLSLDKNAPEFQPYKTEDLNKIAFWNATGSGKTLLMHVNILQYLHYTQNKKDLTVFVITPNEGLSKQHLEEFYQSNFSAVIFDKNKGIQTSGLFNDIQIIEISKLADKDGDSTVAVESFSSMNKLVLVDEGHRGSSGNEWLARRQKLIGIEGFAFEYSATFGQAVKDRKTAVDMEQEIRKKKAKLLPEKLTAKQIKSLPLSYEELRQARQMSVFESYAKCVLFDYSYKFFYQDGYGKESLILNMKAEDYENTENLRKYFTACLLSFYQQQYLFAKNQSKLTAYNLEKPLWIFVGNTVNTEDSDILQVIQLFDFFLNPKNRTMVNTWLAELVEDKTTLLDSKGNAIFKHRFHYLSEWKGNIDGLYLDILQKVFNAESLQTLRLSNIKKAAGEIALSVGNSSAFGVINVGDTQALMKEAGNYPDLHFSQDEFSVGLFSTINKKESSINLLIGSRKFTEGWSSWRVSTMGLLNMGRGEGSQIIQLFGRGVRLKGEDFSLKRTARPPKGLGLDKLETLNVFGIKADYMQKFREYLQEEGVNTEETLQVEFAVAKNLPKNVQLKTLRLKEGYKDNQKMGFKRQEKAELYHIPEKYQGKIKPILAVMDLYPKLEALSTTGIRKSLNDERLEVKLNPQAIAFFDWDNIYLEIQQYKMNRTWSNLQVSLNKLRHFVETNKNWYCLFAPQSVVEIQTFADIEKQQEILIELLKIYTEQFYNRLKAAYENQFFETTYVTEENGSLLDKYQFELREEPQVYNRESVVKKLEVLSNLIREHKIDEAMQMLMPFNELTMICFKPHLFTPLLHLEKSTEDFPIKLSPLPLNAESERQFVMDLEIAEKSGKLTAWLGGKSLYLMRNADRKEKGLGFALAGNFYPDFLLWVVDHQSGKQWLNFIDPKGIRNMDKTDPKFGLYQEVKTLQEKINDPNLILNSFILSITKYEDWINIDQTAEELAEKHILFMDNEDYLVELFERME
ncbi:DEAD/DEAH box helicase family protein [Ursidibacter arcticus]